MYKNDVLPTYGLCELRSYLSLYGSEETKGTTGTFPEVFALLCHGVSTPVKLNAGAVSVKN